MFDQNTPILNVINSYSHHKDQVYKYTEDSHLCLLYVHIHSDFYISVDCILYWCQARIEPEDIANTNRLRTNQGPRPISQSCNSHHCRIAVGQIEIRSKLLH